MAFDFGAFTPVAGFLIDPAGAHAEREKRPHQFKLLRRRSRGKRPPFAHLPHVVYGKSAEQLFAPIGNEGIREAPIFPEGLRGKVTSFAVVEPAIQGVRNAQGPYLPVDIPVPYELVRGFPIGQVKGFPHCLTMQDAWCPDRTETFRLSRPAFAFRAVTPIEREHPKITDARSTKSIQFFNVLYCQQVVIAERDGFEPR